MKNLAILIENMPEDEKAIIEALIKRMEHGRKTSGPWKINNNKNNPQEALEEVLDALHYCAAELVRLSRVIEGD